MCHGVQRAKAISAIEAALALGGLEAGASMYRTLLTAMPRLAHGGTRRAEPLRMVIAGAQKQLSKAIDPYRFTLSPHPSYSSSCRVPGLRAANLL